MTHAPVVCPAAVLSDDTGAVSNVHEMDAGDLGGVMKCGESVAISTAGS
jgi:hypothetical protein